MNRLVELSKRYIPIILVIASVSGCMSIGSSEYSCPGLEEGVICMSTRDVYEATENSNTVRKDSVKKSKHVDDRSAEIIDSRDHSTEELKANLEYYKDKAISDPSTENVTA